MSLQSLFARPASLPVVPKVVGHHHGEVSAELALRWSFPSEIADVLRQVPAPLRGEPPLPMAAWVHVAAWRARVELFQWDAEQAQATCPQSVAMPCIDRSPGCRSRPRWQASTPR